MRIGYARVATADQSLEPQRQALQSAGCAQCFTDIASGAKAERPGLAAALEACRRGDMLIVWRLDRIGRSLRELVTTVHELLDRGVGFQSLQEGLDTSQSGSDRIGQLFAALAECERERILERTEMGRTAARAQGRTGGRPRGVADARKRQAVLALKQQATHTVMEICQRVGISRNTYYKYLRTPSPASEAEPVPTPSSPESAAAEVLSPAPGPRVMKVQLWLEVENNNRYVHGKTKARAEIERRVLRRYGMRQADVGGPEYVLTIPYSTDEELDRIIYDEIWREADSIADGRNCFVEGDTISLDDPDRIW